MRIEKSIIGKNPPLRKPEQGLVLKGKERKKIDPCCEEGTCSIKTFVRLRSVESTERNKSCLVVNTGKALCLHLELAVCELCKTSLTYFF
jgi:hypothetical protein